MKIEGIKKVALSLQWGASQDELKDLSGTLSMEFIYGIGLVGLSPFEASLSGKEPGEELSIRIQNEALADYFVHLAPGLQGIPAELEDIYLLVKVISVSEAGEKEVIRAMAEMASCGEHCCGGH